MPDETEDEIDEIVSGVNQEGVRLRLFKMSQKVAQARARTKEIADEFAAFKLDAGTHLEAANERIATLEPFEARTVELEGIHAGFEIDNTIRGAGITDAEGIKVARMMWDGIAEDKRHAGGLEGWLGEDNRAELPRAVSAYFGDGQTEHRRSHDPNNGVRQQGSRPSGGIARGEVARHSASGTWKDSAERSEIFGGNPPDYT